MATALHSNEQVAGAEMTALLGIFNGARVPTMAGIIPGLVASIDSFTNDGSDFRNVD